MMIDVAVITGLVWLLCVHCILRGSYSKYRRECNAELGYLLDNVPTDTGRSAEEFMDAVSDAAKGSEHMGVSIAHASYAIFASAVCIGALILLVALNNMYGMPPAGWMSVLLLPVPTCMLAWYIYDWYMWNAGGRLLGIVRSLAVSVKQPVVVNTIVLAVTALLAAPVLLIVQVVVPLVDSDSQLEGAVDVSIGIFAVISGLVVIIAGGAALRLLYINKEYRERIRAIDEKLVDVVGRSGRTLRRGGEQPNGESFGDAHGAVGSSLSVTYKELADIGSKREANGRGVLVDGICMTTICIVGFATALDNSLSPLASSVVAGASFLCAVVPLHYHIRNALSLP